nr:hypothetical protein CFP56_50921 [Quercus suber]
MTVAKRVRLRLRLRVRVAPIKLVRFTGALLHQRVGWTSLRGHHKQAPGSVKTVSITSPEVTGATVGRLSLIDQCRRHHRAHASLRCCACEFVPQERTENLALARESHRGTRPIDFGVSGRFRSESPKSRVGPPRL